MKCSVGLPSPAADELDDFQAVALLEDGLGVGGFWDDFCVTLNGNAPRVRAEAPDQGIEGEPWVHGAGRAV